ncbi:MAG: hypothetical protein C5B51_29715 [Terriglobia bacterium]|nr:MAG: hypothetical protein C5B51_29715 [Terriglobia bacterium]
MTGASTGIGASYVDRIAKWGQGLVSGARDLMDSRKQERLGPFSRRIARESFDEMLCDIPAAAVTSYWSTGDSSPEQLTQKMASPFGDWR